MDDTDDRDGADAVDDAEAVYDRWAEFYHASLDPDHDDGSFYRDLAREADGPTLEVACGTGRIYLDLLRDGVDADGIDVSRAMLDVLEREAARDGLDPSVRQADVRTFESDREYGLVVVAFVPMAVGAALGDILPGS